MTDWFDLFETMTICCDKLLDNRRLEEDGMYADLRYWDAFLKKYCETLNSFLERRESSKAFAEAAKEMISNLYKGDSWLLRYLEIKAGSDKAKYEDLLEEWINKLDAIPLGEGCLTLDALFEAAIRARQEENDEDAVAELLERKVRNCDMQSTFMKFGASEASKLRRKIWCTDNSMALMHRYVQSGDRQKLAEMIADIRATDEEFDSVILIDRFLSDRPVLLIEKYIVLLEAIGETEEAGYWRKKLFALTEAGPDGCRMLYQQGRITEALEDCKMQMECDCEDSIVDYDERMSLLEYLLDDSNSLTTLHEHSNHVQITGNDWGFFVVCADHDEWKQFFADIDSMAELYARGRSEEFKEKVYAPEEYMLQYSYQPNTVSGKGSYIKYIYGTGSKELERFFSRDILC